ncbi:hypothetical protein AO385_1199 [Moraxella catarrhalis]|uniref:Uncharacterized protein n=1 Tax=Moraxella catarrhalis TaxID=480 RepID=A0A198ULI6_MORCA|nr:hypothetical protein AO384_1139 [Moraxella catarrhalis]OAU96631.1 hypothetical protein AO383_1503 [Moraxella catarrhalis]OAV00498.1 hypothetical protein AO385_1199 [Moraxella catarrhalis]OAV01154.1 hypothetical protein AO382_0911 [Moraxella catarrhalis]
MMPSECHTLLQIQHFSWFWATFVLKSANFPVGSNNQVRSFAFFM